jgi:hypothetical protein
MYRYVYLAEHVHPLPGINKCHILRRRHDHRPYFPLSTPLQFGKDERRTIDNHQLSQTKLDVPSPRWHVDHEDVQIACGFAPIYVE